MKIGTLTYHFANNYGAVLQAYALKTYLEEQGHDVEILNYNSSFLYRKNRALLKRVVSLFWSRFRLVIGGAKKNKAFSSFRLNYLGINGEQITLPTELKNYLKDKNFNAFVVGSDQVWNPVLNGADKNYYLAFANSALKVSYAASFGVSKVEERFIPLIRDNVKEFSAVSVREKTGLEILKNCSVENSATVVLDPVFLLSQEGWNKLASKRLIKEKYILCYVMPGDKKLENKITETANKLKKETGYKVVYIGRKEYYRFINDGKDMVGASPEDFVSLIKNAEVVLTNSFHGTAFSVIFQRDFYSFKNSSISKEKQLSSRIQDLLSDIGLETRIIDSNKNLASLEKINYDTCNQIIKSKIKDSKNFLLNVLK